MYSVFPQQGDAARGPAGRLFGAGLLMLIAAYRSFVSPLLGPSCRFHPTCSAYAQEAIRRHGAFRGVLLASGRILRCQPLGTGGYDPVV
ncbi:MAG: membrane protein insertion efficiency factor YidD [Deltaproteobacteria bacterium]|jgi:hypothetical protein